MTIAQGIFGIAISEKKLTLQDREVYSVCLKFCPNGTSFPVLESPVNEPIQGVTESIDQGVSGLCDEV